MRLRWPRFLPGFPAILLVPAVLGFSVTLNSARLEARAGNPSYGFPLTFKGYFEVRGFLPGTARILAVDFYEYEFRITPLLIDLIIALTVAYSLAMAADRLVFPAIRGGRRRKRGSGETG